MYHIYLRILLLLFLLLLFYYYYFFYNKVKSESQYLTFILKGEKLGDDCACAVTQPEHRQEEKEN